MVDARSSFEQSVVARMMEGGFLEIEIRTECLARCDDGYQDEVINAGWNYWQESRRKALEEAVAHVEGSDSWVSRFKIADTIRALIEKEA